MTQFGFEQCPYCGNTQGFIYVHSHYQCGRCGNNVMPCCGGEQDVEEKEKGSVGKSDLSE